MFTSKTHTSLTTLLLTGLFSLLSLFSTTTFAHTTTETDTPKGHHIHFSVTEQQRVENDLMSVTFRYTAQATSAELVMQAINQKMQAAIRILKPFKDIETKTQQYRVSPVYNKKQLITHWQGQQSLVITTPNRAGLPKLFAQLQPYLNYQSMSFHVSEDTQEEIKAELLSRALKSYQQKAKFIARSFNAPHYELVETHIDTPALPRQPADRYAVHSRMMAESVAAPVMESGKSTIKLHIRGQLFISH